MRELDLSTVSAPGQGETPTLEACFLRLLADPSIASKRWIYRQYDHQVQTNTVVLPGSDAAVVRIATEQGDRFIAMSVDCNGRHCLLDPREGAKGALAEAVRNVTLSGAQPLACTDNLNFGNPHNPELFWQLREAVEGMSEACRVFETPVTGGNVSLYNQNPNGAIDPTPTVAVVGLIEDERHITRSFFRTAGDAILLVGGVGSELGGSSYLNVIHGLKRGIPPQVDLAKEKLFCDSIRDLIRSEGAPVHSAHDCSDGGLAIALAECCFEHGLGAEIDLSGVDGVAEIRSDVLWFNESHGRAILSLASEQVEAALAHFRRAGVPAVVIGSVQAEPTLSLRAGDRALVQAVSVLRDTYEGTLPRLMGS